MWCERWESDRHRRSAAGRVSGATVIIGYIAIAEAVREYLIDIGIVQPLGRLEKRHRKR